MREWSHSCLALYERCPLAWKLRYINGEKGIPSPAMIRGKQVHEFCEAYTHHCHAENAETDYDYGRELMASLPADVRQVCETFMETTPFDWSLIVADGESVERDFSVALPYDLGQFRGRVDLVQWNAYAESLIVTDYKSGWAPYPKPERCPTQLRCYAWAMMQEFPAAREVTAIYRHLGDNVSHDWILYQPEPEWAISLIRRIEADDRYEATPSPRSCAWCDYTHVCPLANVDPETVLTSEAQAKHTLEQLAAIEARRDKLRQALNDWVDEHGEVRANGQRAGKYPPKSVEEIAPGEYVYTDRYDLACDGADELVEALMAAGLDDDRIQALWPEPQFDAKAAAKLVAERERDEDPFGSGEEDPVLEVLREYLVCPAWTGSMRFRIDPIDRRKEERR